MPFGHSSHQVGLDIDIWYKPAPDHELSAEEREKMKMESFLLDAGHVNPEVWKREIQQLLRRAVSYPEVARIFVNPAIKKWLCDNAEGRPPISYEDHPDHGPRRSFPCAARLPGHNAGCENQVFKADEGCGKGSTMDRGALETEARAAVPGAPPPAGSLRP